MLFMLCCQYKVLRITKTKLDDYQKLFLLKELRKDDKDILNPSSVFTFSKLSEKDIFNLDHPNTLIDGVLKEGIHPKFDSEAWKNNPTLNRVVFGPEVKEFYTKLRIAGTNKSRVEKEYPKSFRFC
jgi:hypothetical protein